MPSTFRLKYGYYAFTPAKVNFRLTILEKLPNNYHRLLMDIMPIDLCEQLVFFPSGNSAWQTNPTAGRLMVQKAIAAIAAWQQLDFFLDFRLVKHLPWQAGIGASSANAAGALLLLAHILEIDPYSSKIFNIAASIGADVPFFLRAKAALAKNIGTTLEPLVDYRSLALIILKPKFNIATADAYASFQPQPISCWPSLEDVFDFPPTVNKFWTSRLPHFAELQKIRLQMLEYEQVKNVLLTGSGSSLLLLFDNAHTRDHFYLQHCAHLPQGIFYKANTLQQFHYQITKFN